MILEVSAVGNAAVLGTQLQPVLGLEVTVGAAGILVPMIGVTAGVPAFAGLCFGPDRSGTVASFGTDGLRVGRGWESTAGRAAVAKRSTALRR